MNSIPAKALVETERRVEALREELDALRRSREKVFQAPPVEWIEERLAGMQEVLERRTDRTAVRVLCNGGPGRKGFEPRARRRSEVGGTFATR